MFERLKEKLHFKKKEEFDELKRHITSPRIEPISHEFRERFNPKGGFAPPRYEERGIIESEAPRSEDIAPTFETFEEFPSREIEPISLSDRREGRSIERIEDEIRFIKEQLSAIKAIVETINERVKDVQRSLERRY